MASLIAALLLGQVFGQTTFAPADVPRDHWAFPAVNEMFREGLLTGYPAAPTPELKLDPKAEFEEAWLVKWRGEMRTGGWLVGDPVGLGRTGNRPSSRYEFAIMVHATFVNMHSIAAQPGCSLETRRLFASKAKDMVKAIGMCRPELIELEVDVSKVMAQINADRKLVNRTFQAPSKG
ncbi:hypothetical protein EON79_06345 [bacterium]|nr:MAG: hypothetical protein EON79_06345 [bacterium]